VGDAARAATATDAAARSALPHWDLSGLWPGLESQEFADAFAQTIGDIADLERLFDDRAVGATGPADPAAFDEVLERLNAVLDEAWTTLAYIYAFVTTDSRDELAQARASEFRQQTATLSKLETRFTAWVGGMDVEALIASSELARSHAFAIRRAKELAEHLMSEPEESLAADLNLSSGAAWQKLHSDVASQIDVPFSRNGEERTLPMSELRALAHDADRDVRRRAYEAELEAWQRVAVPLAAAMNSLKGQVNTLTARRGWETPLDEALFASRIDRATLDAMFAAVRESFPDLRRYLDAKARVLGAQQLAWYDLFAPVSTGSGDGRRVWDFATAERFIVEHFAAYSDRLREFAERAFRGRWIDAEPRPGKTDGAFCMPLWKDESRILANYTVAYGGVSTLAHELGHGYHNLVKAPLTQLQKRTPMTLAETASIFCETIVRQAALEQGSRAEQVEILEGSLQDNLQVTIDTLSRFLFESRVFAERRTRELSVDELCEAMLDAQRETYGDGLDASLLHPYMWAVKPHYYGERSFYNYPYTFGLLFGLGLYSLYEQDPESFRASYDDLLASTGQAEAAELAARFDMDIRRPEFWRGSLGIIVADIDRFESLASQA
jgi:oligoendopeptidase F